MHSVTFIARKGAYVLWSFGNYQYQIEGNGIKKNMECDLEDALKVLESM